MPFVAPSRGWVIGTDDGGSLTRSRDEPECDKPDSLGPGGVRSIALPVTTTWAMPAFLVATLAIEIRHSMHFGTTELGAAVSVYYPSRASSSITLSLLTEPVAVPATNMYVPRTVHGDLQGLAFNANSAAVALASALGELAVPSIALTVRWRWAFAPGAVVAVASLAAVPGEHAAAGPSVDEAADGPLAVVLAPLVVLAVGIRLGVFATGRLMTFLATEAVGAGFDKGAVGLLGAAAACLVAGRRSDRRRRKHLPIVATMLALGATLRIGWLFAGAAGNAAELGWGWVGVVNHVVVRSHAQAPVRVIAITQVGGRLGAMLGPLAVGVIAGHGSFGVAWAVLAQAAGFASGSVVFRRALLLRVLG